MADQRTADLPEGTDTIIEGAANAGRDTDRHERHGLVTEREIPAPMATPSGRHGSGNPGAGWPTASAAAASKLVRARPAKRRAAWSARASSAPPKRSPMSPRWSATPPPGSRSASAPEYGDYARRAAGGDRECRQRASPKKDPDELIDDTREFVRNSPGIALAGAAVVGFVVARLVKSGLAPGTMTTTRIDAQAG